MILWLADRFGMPGQYRRIWLRALTRANLRPMEFEVVSLHQMIPTTLLMRLGSRKAPTWVPDMEDRITTTINRLIQQHKPQAVVLAAPESLACLGLAPEHATLHNLRGSVYWRGGIPHLVTLPISAWNSMVTQKDIGAANYGFESAERFTESRPQDGQVRTEAEILVDRLNAAKAARPPSGASGQGNPRSPSGRVGAEDGDAQGGNQQCVGRQCVGSQESISTEASVDLRPFVDHDRERSDGHTDSWNPGTEESDRGTAQLHPQESLGAAGRNVGGDRIEGASVGQGLSVEATQDSWRGTLPPAGTRFQFGQRAGTTQNESQSAAQDEHDRLHGSDDSSDRGGTIGIHPAGESGVDSATATDPTGRMHRESEQDASGPEHRSGTGSDSSGTGSPDEGDGASEHRGESSDDGDLPDDPGTSDSDEDGERSTGIDDDEEVDRFFYEPVLSPVGQFVITADLNKLKRILLDGKQSKGPANPLILNWQGD